MKAKKSRVVLSSVSVLLVLSLLAGMTMAWFTDTEKVNANFTAGVLDISVKPGETDKGDLTFENLRPMLYDNFYKELEPNGNEKWVNDVTQDNTTDLDDEDYAPVPAYFKPVTITNEGTLPTKVKLSPKEPDKIEYIIANCAECEPYITADYRRMLEYTEDLVSGMKVILSLFPNARGVFAVEDNKKDCIEKLQKAVAGEPRIDVKALMTKYPQGAERQLIYAVTKRAINSTMLPADVGCIVDNVETLIGIHNAVIKGKPLMERVVTVSGDAVEKPGNFMAPFGINHRELVEAAGGLKAEPQKLISGGPMMGFAMVTMDAPVTKTSSSILLFKEDVVAKSLETACINCGRCVEICPSRIIPSRLADFSKRKDEASFVAWNGLECVECGSCSYVCPAKRQLKQAIGSMRKTALANRKKK